MLSPEQRDALVLAAARLFPPHNVLVAYAFGSRVHGSPRPDSDLDVGYYTVDWYRGHALTLRDEMFLAGELSAVIGVEVDLRNLGDAPLELRGRVLEEGVRIYSGDAAARVALERDTIGRYHDYKDIFREMHAQRLKAIAERGL